MLLQELSSMVPVIHTPCCPSTSVSGRSITTLLASITKHAIIRVCAAKSAVEDLPFIFIREFGLVRLLLTCCYTHMMFSLQGLLYFLLKTSIANSWLPLHQLGHMMIMTVDSSCTVYTACCLI